jgi:hypothetical protein
MKGSTILAGVLAVTAAASCAKSENQAYTTPDTKAKAAAYIDDPTRLSEKEISERASDAYLFGYPLVLMDVTRETMTSEDDAARGRGPSNQLTHMRELPDHTFTDVVSPNVDTLYSSAWLDLKDEPMVVTVPNTGGRYNLFQILDGWTNVTESLGSRTTGTDELEFAIVGPDYQGRLPRGVKRVDSPTQMAWLIGRVHTRGSDDTRAVHAIQDAIQMRPLSVYEGKKAPQPSRVGKQKASAATSGDPAERVASMDPQTFFARLNKLMAKNPPTQDDAAAMARFEAIGVSPGKPFSLARFTERVSGAIEKGAKQGNERLGKLASKPVGKEVNGWVVVRDAGEFGTDYKKRAAVAHMGLGANLPEDAVYPFATRDADGKPLDGNNRYVLHFEKDEVPPVKAFWSLTAYDQEHRLTENDADRHAVGDQGELTKNADGSITLYLQSESPGKEKEANWLPIPREEFNVILRLYWPEKEVVSGSWTPPPIERVRG